MRQRPTIADLRAWKGRRQLSMLRYFSLEEAGAAEAAGIDVASVPPELVTHPRYREVAPSVFSMTGRTHLEAGTPEDYLRWAGGMMQAGADAIYCSGSLRTVEYLAREHIPVVGHVGLVPSRATWTGGFRAVGKTAQAALALYEEVRAYQAAGAFAVEIEVVPVEVASAISARVEILLWSMGSGPGCGDLPPERCFPRKRAFGPVGRRRNAAEEAQAGRDRDQAPAGGRVGVAGPVRGRGGALARREAVH
jgi:3-methyl-2-oxobutanoate hydroxymethyltransferase